jgi:hypothetical protein
MVSVMSELADAVLPLIRTSADLSRWAAANEHGGQVHVAVAILRSSAETTEPRDVLAVTEKAIASAPKVIMWADERHHWRRLPRPAGPSSQGRRAGEAARRQADRLDDQAGPVDLGSLSRMVHPDAAVALAEIGEFDFAIDWARHAVEFGRGHQSLRLATTGAGCLPSIGPRS